MSSVRIEAARKGPGRGGPCVAAWVELAIRPSDRGDGPRNVTPAWLGQPRLADAGFVSPGRMTWRCLQEKCTRTFWVITIKHRGLNSTAL